MGVTKGVPVPWGGTVVGNMVPAGVAPAVIDFEGVWVICGVEVAGPG
jgi:hypothetical protein